MALKNECAQVVPAELETAADVGRKRGVSATPRTDNRGGLIAVVPTQHRVVARQQSPGLLGEGGEDLLGRCAAGDECRHPSQGRLLFGIAEERRSRLGIGDRDAYEFGEDGKTRLCIPGHRLEASDDHDPPQLALDIDRHADRRAQSKTVGKVGDRSGCGGVVVDPCGLPCLRHQRRNILTAKARLNLRCRDTPIGTGPYANHAHVAAVVPFHER
jgi:hypothetical protein